MSNLKKYDFSFNLSGLQDYTEQKTSTLISETILTGDFAQQVQIVPNVKGVKEMNNPEAEYNKNKESIINKAGEMNLGKEVESDLPASFDQAKQNFDGKLKAEQNKINVKQAKMEANYDEFSKRNKVNDWSTEIKDRFFGRKPIEKPTGKLDDE